MILNETAPVQIPSNLIKTIKLQNKDTIAQKYKFETIGSNGYIDIEPSVAKFTGYEINKLNIVKIKLVNSSTKAQRVHVLPPSTQFFSIKFDKKGTLAPGMSEDIQIHFTPNEYKYYFDSIRVHTEVDQLQIPIHAYPVMNRENIRDVFPKLIDFGICIIGTSQTMKFPLACKIPLNFEFEFIGVKEADDIRIFPSKGIIPGKGTVEIEISYNPSMGSTVIAEYHLNISQFDFDPIPIKIMGSGKHRDQEFEADSTKNLKKKRLTKLEGTKIVSMTESKPTNEKINESLAEIASLKETDRTPRMDSSQQQIDQENNNNNNNNNNNKQDTNTNYKSLMGSAKFKQTGQLPYNDADEKQKFKTTTIKPESPLLKQSQNYLENTLDSTKRQSLEKQFINKVNDVANREKEKMIKFFECIGDPDLTQQERESMINERQTYQNKHMNDFEESGVTRYNVKYDEKPAIKVEITPTFNPVYDGTKNDVIWKRRQVLEKLMKAASKIILRNRANKYLPKIKAFLGGAKTREEVKKLVQQDWKKAEYFGIGKKDHILFTFDFDTANVTELQLPIQYELSSSNMDFKFELAKKIEFDDFISIDPLPLNDVEIMGYKLWSGEQTALNSYMPIEVDRIDRVGAEEEYGFSGRTGPVDPLESLKELLEPVPPNLLKPFDFEGYTLICPHPTLKTIEPLLEITEIDPDFNLQPQKIKFNDVLDPNMDTDYELIKQEYLKSTPGIDGTRAINWLPIEYLNYFTHRLVLPYDIGLEDKIEKDCPESLQNALDEDKYSDSDSDDHKSVDLDIPEVEDFLGTLEVDDQRIKDIRKNNEKIIIDEREDILQNINHNFENERSHWASVLPTKTIETNKLIQAKNNIIPIL